MARAKVVGALAAVVAATSGSAHAQNHDEHPASHASAPRPAVAPHAPPPRPPGGGDHRFDGAAGQREFLPGTGPRPGPGAPRSGYAGQAQGGPVVRSYQGQAQGQGGAPGGPVVRSYQGGRGPDGYAGYTQGRNAPQGAQRFSGQGYDAYRGGGDGRGGYRSEDGRGVYGGPGYRGQESGRDGYVGRGFGGEHGFDRRGGEGRGFGYDRGDRRAFYYGGRTFYRVHAEQYRWPDRRWIGYRWYAGAFLPPIFLADDYFLTGYVDFGLPPPPYGCQWVRVGYDALLVNVDTGEVLDVVPGVFY